MPHILRLLEVIGGSHYEASPSLATVLNPLIGYMKAAEIAKESVKTGVPIRKLIVDRKIATKPEADRLLDPAALTVPPEARKGRGGGK